MNRRAARFTEADAFRAAKAAKRVGVAVEIAAMPLHPFDTKQDHRNVRRLKL